MSKNAHGHPVYHPRCADWRASEWVLRTSQSPTLPGPWAVKTPLPLAVLSPAICRQPQNRAEQNKLWITTSQALVGSGLGLRGVGLGLVVGSISLSFSTSISISIRLYTYICVSIHLYIYMSIIWTYIPIGLYHTRAQSPARRSAEASR